MSCGARAGSGAKNVGAPTFPKWNARVWMRELAPAFAGDGFAPKWSSERQGCDRKSGGEPSHSTFLQIICKMSARRHFQKWNAAFGVAG